LTVSMNHCNDGTCLWSKGEIKHLFNGVKKYCDNWSLILEKYPFAPTKTPTVLYRQYQIYYKRNVIPFSTFSPESDDDELIDIVVNTRTDMKENCNNNDNIIQLTQKHHDLKNISEESLCLTCPVLRSKSDNGGHSYHFTKKEIDNLIAGVKTFGHSWKRILKCYSFRERSAVSLMQKYRRIVRITGEKRKKDPNSSTSFEARKRHKAALDTQTSQSTLALGQVKWMYGRTPCRVKYSSAKSIFER